MRQVLTSRPALSVSTVDTHRAQLTCKLHATSVVELVRIAVRNEIVEV
jgi:DNA-binding NarL/FixJ family response regulator